MVIIRFYFLLGCADQLCAFCPPPAWCWNCPHYRLCLTTIGFGSHSPSCSFSTLALCSLEESRPVSGIMEQHHLKAGGVGTQLQRHMLLCPGHPWGTKLPPLPGTPCPEASAGFPAILTRCRGRSRSRCCTCCRRCHRLVSSPLGKLPKTSHPW